MKAHLKTLVTQLPADDDTLLDAATLASLLGLSVRGLERWRQDGRGPAIVRLSHRAIRYRAGAVRKWLAEQERRAAEGRR
jgi:predicted DNA-binding transcriptional regulator AlpA